MLITIKTEADVKQLKAGDAYIIDVYPDPSEEDQLITDEMFALENTLQAAIEKHLTEPAKEKPASRKKAKK